MSNKSSKKLINFRLTQSIIDRMNANKINKTALVQRLLNDYFDGLDKKSFTKIKKMNTIIAH